MWSDEGLSLYRAQLPLSEITANVITVDGIATQDTNPPFYFLLLHILILLAGESVFALRYLGVAAATLAIPAMYGLGFIAFGRRVGILAALLIAISPFHIWQAQVLRNYSLLLTLNLLSVYGLIRFLTGSKEGKRGRWLFVWAVAGLVGIYTHYFGFFVFAFGILALIAFYVKEQGFGRLRGKRSFWIVVILSSIILIPALVIALDRFLAGTQVDFFPVPLQDVLIQAAGVFSVGMNWTLTQPWWRVLPVILIATAGVWFAWKNQPKATLLFIGYQLIPIAMLLAASLINPLYNGLRHLLIGLPPFLIFVASGLVGPFQLESQRTGQNIRRLWRWVAPVFGVFLIISQIQWLNAQFTSPELIRDDIRGAAEYLNEHATPDDIVWLHDTIIKFTFDYYYQGTAPVVSAPRFSNMSIDSAIEDIQTSTKENQRIWFLDEPTPRTGFDRAALADWAETNWIRIFDQSFPSMWLRVGLKGYINEPFVTSVPERANPVEIIWDDALQLHGYDIPDEIQAGDEWWLTFYLSQPTIENEQHLISLYLVDEQGNSWGPMDQVITRGFPPASGQADSPMRYDHRVSIPPGIPAGDYQLWMRLIRTEDEFTVPLANGQLDLHLTDVAVEASRCDDDSLHLPADIQTNTRFGNDIALFSYDLPLDAYPPGHLISLNLWWCTLKAPKADYYVHLEILDAHENVVSESASPLTQINYPSSQWAPGELVMGRADIIVPGQVREESHEVRLSLRSADTGEALPTHWPLGPKSIALGNFMVQTWPLDTSLPELSSPIEAVFGKSPMIELHGYELLNGQEVVDQETAPGETLGLSLIWRSVSEMINESYSVFIHVVNEDEQIIAQSDGVPASGLRPTTSWRNREVITDVHAISIPESTEPGTYQIWIGLYDPTTGIRVPLFVNGDQLPDDRLLLHSLLIDR
jgi:hypothetical protein